MPITITALYGDQLLEQCLNNLNDHEAIKSSLLDVVRLIQHKHCHQKYFNSESMLTAFSAGTQLTHELNDSNNTEQITQALSSYQTRINCLPRLSLDLDDNVQAFLEQTSYIPGVKTTLMSPRGRKYVGQFWAGKLNGHGIYTWADGQKYQGQFENDKAHGLGVLTWPNGEKYSGHFLHGEMHGNGVFTWPDNQKYEGQFHNGQIYDRGTVTCPDGQKYEGWFQRGKRHGQGTYTWPDGTKYEGRFCSDKMHGQGIITWTDGRKYAGQFKHGMWHGKGTYSWPDNTKYKGFFIASIVHNGTTISPEGRRVKGCTLPLRQPLPIPDSNYECNTLLRINVQWR